MKGRLSAELGRRLALLGLPLVPAVLAQWVSEFANRAILLSQSGPQEVAYFSVATRFSSIALLVVLGFQLAWQPAAFSLGEGRAALQQVATDGRRIMAGVAGSVVAVALSSPELVVLAGGRQYSPALPAVGLSLVFALGYAAYHTATLPSAISRRMRDLGLAAVLAAAIGITLNLWLSGMWGATGTAAAIAVGQVGAAAVGFLLARARAPVPYPWGRILVISGAAGFRCVRGDLPRWGRERCLAGGVGSRIPRRGGTRGIAGRSSGHRPTTGGFPCGQAKLSRRGPIGSQVPGCRDPHPHRQPCVPIGEQPPVGGTTRP
ncbi:MAG: hypothetical protein M5U19_14415 [Microthrixaceae bacterium]|nr:hypothetical protein [Microthrixaceae bacterium]